MIRPITLFVLSVCLLLGVGLVNLILGLPVMRAELAGLVASHLPQSGVSHPVTAVLLNFRAYDTLLEVLVMILAPLVALALPQDAPAPDDEPDLVLDALLRVILPAAVLMAVFLLLVGSSRSGGAFHAAAVLAGGAVLLRLARPIAPPTSSPRHLRCLLAGLGVFLAVAVCSAFFSGYFLGYPAGWAGPLILLVEAALAFSLAFALWALFP